MKLREEKKGIDKKIIIKAVSMICVVIFIGILITLNDESPKKNVDEQTNKTIDDILSDLREEEKKDVVIQKNEKHIVISNELESLISDEQKTAINELTNNSRNDGLWMLDTEYAKERTAIKEYCKREIKRIAECINEDTDKEDGYSDFIICNIKNGFITINIDYESCKDYINQIEGLMGIYQSVADNQKNWCVVVYTQDGSYSVSDKNIENKVIKSAATETDAKKENGGD